MRTPSAVWAACAEDERWIDHQAAVVDEIMREAFAAGFAAGAELTTRCVAWHLDRLASNLAMRVPASVPRGLQQLLVRAREIALDAPVVQRAWRAAVAGVALPTIQLVPSNEGAKVDMPPGEAPAAATAAQEPHT